MSTTNAKEMIIKYRFLKFVMKEDMQQQRDIQVYADVDAKVREFILLAESINGLNLRY